MKINKRRHENIEKRTAGLYCSTYGNPLVGSVGPCSVFSGLRFVIFNGVWVGFLKSKCYLYLGLGDPHWKKVALKFTFRVQ